METTRSFAEQKLREIDLASKYPSIPAYHTLGDRGILTEEHIDFEVGCVHASEKIDGTNARIVILGSDSCFIGSREKLLWYHGDLLFNPSMNIVPALQATAMRLAREALHAIPPKKILVVYGEVFGGNIGKNAKNYTVDRNIFDFRVFDVAIINPQVLMHPVETIALWRDHGGQHFLDIAYMQDFCRQLQLNIAPVVQIPRPPTAVGDMLPFLKATIPTSLAAHPGSGRRPEGLVVRTADRSQIAKIRYEDYEKYERTKCSTRSVRLTR